MEIHEYLASFELKVGWSSKKIRNALEKLKANKSPKATFQLIDINWKENGTEFSGWDAFAQFLMHKKDELSRLGITDVMSIPGISALFTSIAEHKEYSAKKVRERVVKESLTLPNYSARGITIEKTPIQLFSTVYSIKPNEFDRDLLGCFAVMGSTVVFRAGNKCSMLMTKITGNNEQVVFSSSDSSQDSIYDKIIEYITPRWEVYYKKLQSMVAALPERPEDDEMAPIEKIYLEQVPTVMRHVTEVVITKNAEGFFRSYQVRAKKNAITEPTAEAFVDWLASNFSKAIRGTIDKENKFLSWSNNPAELSASHFLIWPEKEWSVAKMPTKWSDFLSGKASKRLLHRLYFYLGAMLDANNTAQQYLAISDAGQTGKGTLIKLLERVLPEGCMTSFDNKAFDENDKFTLSSVSVWNYHVAHVKEYDGKSLNGPKGKSIIGGDRQTLDMKFMRAVEWDPTGFRLIVPSNYGFILKSHSVRRRCIPITFNATHCSIDNYNNDDLNELAEQGNDFLKFCWRVYMQSPLRQKDGGFFVACPEDEKMFLEGNWYVEYGKKDKNGKAIKEPAKSDYDRYLRAFSRDEELSDYYTVDDYEDTELTEAYSNVIGKYFDEVKDGYVLATDFYELASSYSESDPLFRQAFNDALQKNGSGLTFNFRASSYKTWKRYLEDHGHKVKKNMYGIAYPGYTIKKCYIDEDGKIKKNVKQFGKSDSEEINIGIINNNDIMGLI